MTSETSQTGHKAGHTAVGDESPEKDPSQRRLPRRIVSIARARPSFIRRKNTSPLKHVADEHSGKAFHSSKYLEDTEEFKIMHQEMEDRLRTKKKTHAQPF